MSEIDSGRRLLITGGTAGIGAMCARYLTDEGHAVWVTGTREQTVADTLDRNSASGGTVCDVTDPCAVNRAFSEASQALGGLDGVFINAGILGRGLPAEKLCEEAFRRVLDVNVIGSLTCAQAAHRFLARPGVIVLNASVSALRPDRLFVHYNVSKAGVVALATTLALEWSHEGLAVMCVCPGTFPTRMTAPSLDDPLLREQELARIPMARFGEPSEIAAMVSFLLSGKAPYLSGAVIPIAGASNV